MPCNVWHYKNLCSTYKLCDQRLTSINHIHKLDVTLQKLLNTLIVQVNHLVTRASLAMHGPPLAALH